MKNNEKIGKIPFSVAMSVYYKDNAAFFDKALQSITEKQSVMPAEIVLVCLKLSGSRKIKALETL